MHSLVLDRQGRIHSTGQGIHGVLGRGGLASMGEELDFREAELWKLDFFHPNFSGISPLNDVKRTVWEKIQEVFKKYDAVTRFM